MEIEILNRQGHSLRQISRELGISTNTVRKYLICTRPPQYGPRPHQMHKLEPYYEYLQRRLKCAYPHRIPGVVLFREIKEMGYPGGITRLNSFLQTIGFKSKADPLVRFSTLPGVQMQVDWVEFRKEKLYAFVATMGYSRASFVFYTKDMQLPTLLYCHEAAFDYFGGIPHEILYDNMKTVVLLRDALGAGNHRFHPALWGFAKHYGFMPRLCRPYRAKTKGKVERFNRYLRYSFHIPTQTKLQMEGKPFDLSNVNALVRSWLYDVANARLHKDTQRIPWELLMEERKYLKFLLAPYSIIEPSQQVQAYQTVPPQHRLSIYDALLEVA